MAGKGRFFGMQRPLDAAQSGNVGRGNGEGMIQIWQFRYAADNLGYVLQGDGEALVIDGGAPETVERLLREKGLVLRGVTNTHGHADHTVGNDALLKIPGARLLDHRRFSEGDTLFVGGQALRVLHTPGHTADAVSFFTGDALLAGDTLFNGTIGNCFTGDLRAFYASIRKLMAYPPDTRIYAGHDYVQDSLAFARRLEPGNRDLDRFLASYDPGHVVSTLADERKINPYLRFNEPSLVAFLRERGLPTGSAWERWESLMAVD